MVDIPVYGLSGWAGQRWMLLYQGNSTLPGDGQTGLGSVVLAFGGLSWPPDPRGYVEVRTHAKRPAMTSPTGARTMATSLLNVSSGALALLVERATAHLPDGSQARRSLRRTLDKRMSAGGAFCAGDGPLPERWWSPISLVVDGASAAGFAARLPGCWAVCTDLGDVIVSVAGNNPRPETLSLEAVNDLRLYPMPGVDD